MLTLENEWTKDDDRQTKKAHYRKMDFYGPFLELDLRLYKSGLIKVTPGCYQIETVEVSQTDFSLLSDVTRELYQKIGPFVFVTKLFEVTIDSERTEELFIEKLKGIRLF